MFQCEGQKERLADDISDVFEQRPTAEHAGKSETSASTDGAPGALHLHLASYSMSPCLRLRSEMPSVKAPVPGMNNSPRYLSRDEL